MPVGDVRVVPNASKTVYYLVRLAGDQTDEELARDEFMQSIVDAPGDGPPFELQYVGQDDKLRMFTDWYEDIEEDYDVHRIDPAFFFGEGA